MHGSSCLSCSRSRMFAGQQGSPEASRRARLRCRGQSPPADVAILIVCRRRRRACTRPRVGNAWTQGSRRRVWRYRPPARRESSGPSLCMPTNRGSPRRRRRCTPRSSPCNDLRDRRSTVRSLRSWRRRTARSPVTSTALRTRTCGIEDNGQSPRAGPPALLAVRTFPVRTAVIACRRDRGRHGCSAPDAPPRRAPRAGLPRFDSQRWRRGKMECTIALSAIVAGCPTLRSLANTAATCRHCGHLPTLRSLGNTAVTCRHCVATTRSSCLGSSCPSCSHPSSET